MYLRPHKTKVILLAESHAHTPCDLVFDGPSLPQHFLSDFTVPRGYITHVNCLTYGKDDCISQKIPHSTDTHQFCKRLGVCAYGFECHEYSIQNKVMHSGNGDHESRFRCNFNLLCCLQSLDISLVDTNIFGWYMSQEQQLVLTESGEAVQKSKQRSQPNLNIGSLVVS